MYIHGAPKRFNLFTENKLLGRLCKMCNPFSYEFQKVMSVNVFKLVCCTATTYNREVKIWRVDPDRRLTQLNRRRGWAGHGLFSDGSMQGRAAGAGAAELLKIVNCSCKYIITCSLLIITTQIMHGLQGQYLKVPMPSSGVHCVMFTL